MGAVKPVFTGYYPVYFAFTTIKGKGGLSPRVKDQFLLRYCSISFG
jgi:hypothetical protein